MVADAPDGARFIATMAPEWAAGSPQMTAAGYCRVGMAVFRKQPCSWSIPG